MNGNSELAHQEKVLVTKPDDLNLIPVFHMLKETISPLIFTFML